jgi:hypothetical protein
MLLLAATARFSVSVAGIVTLVFIPASMTSPDIKSLLGESY